ncbi:MAG: hypothetical protein ABL902_07850 [Gallionella sp.]
MDSKIRTLWLSLAVALVLWILLIFVVNNVLAIIFAMLSIVIVGWAGGNVMNTPEPKH